MHILVRYGEIGLKSGQVRSQFEERLQENLARKLDAAGIDGRIVERDDRIFAEVSEDDAVDAALALSTVPGVVSVSPVANCGEVAFEAIIPTAVDLVEGVDAETFAVDARRAGDDKPFTSQDIAEEVGQAIVDEHGLDVDLDEPDLTVSVEARYTTAFVYTETVAGVGGLPVDTRDPVAVLMRDRGATVAAFRMLKRGCTVFPVYTGDDRAEVEAEMATLRQFDPDVKLTVMDAAPDEALDMAAELYGCKAVVLPHTAEDLAEGLPGTERELLLPNCGESTEEIMERYAEIMHVEA